jgi:hypothetical protein
MRDIMRTVLLLATCLLVLLSVGCPFSKSGSSDLRPIGPTVKADILIYFNSNLSQEEINAFSNDVLSRPHPEGRGRYLPPGVRTFLRLRAVEGHEGIALTFFPNASDEQRQELMKSIKASPIVYKVLENTTPDSVKTLK